MCDRCKCDGTVALKIVLHPLVILFELMVFEMSEQKGVFVFYNNEIDWVSDTYSSSSPSNGTS